uniref:Replication termination factor 2 n=1 Tax=Gasterosteus aculeatus aculeatus TaxID=481459 RepID=A0AAQ4QS08_GASAC
MGCDGGTIPKRHELVKGPKKVEKVDKNAELAAKWKYCALSQEKLRRPIVSCDLGRLYNKDSIIEYLLDKTAERPNVEAVTHIRGIKDIKELNLTDNPEWKGERSNTKGDIYEDMHCGMFICPVVGLEMNGKHRFCYLQTCGCVFSDRALKEVKTEICHKVLGYRALQNKVYEVPGESVVRRSKINLQIVWRRSFRQSRAHQSHMRARYLPVPELRPVHHGHRLLDPRRHVPVPPLFALHVPHQFQVAHDREVLSTQIHHFPPARLGLRQVAHAVHIGLQAGEAGVRYYLAAAGEEDVFEAADQLQHGRLVLGRSLFVHVNAVDVLWHVDGPQQAHKELQLLVNSHNECQRVVLLLPAERPRDEVEVSDQLGALRVTIHDVAFHLQTERMRIKTGPSAAHICDLLWIRLHVHLDVDVPGSPAGSSPHRPPRRAVKLCIQRRRVCSSEARAA